MHGRLKAAEKAAVMDAFKAGALDVLVSTTVIEVGVDVPNANIIVIENAERYGLSALHQLRGRVGRGKGEAYCMLISDHATDAVKKRLLVFVPYERWLRNRKIRSGDARAGRLFRQPAARPAHAAHRGPDGRQPCIVCSPEGGAGARRSGPRRCAAPETRGCDVWPRSCSPATRH